MTIWQIGAGDPGRSNAFPQLFLNHGVMLLGPGRFGHILEQADAYGHLSGVKRGAIQRFAQRVQPGDYVVARVGSRAVGVGVIPPTDAGGGVYQWCADFGDVHGWDLQHTQRVCWTAIETIPDSAARQDAKTLFEGRWSMFSKVNNPGMTERIERLLAHCRVRELPALPTAGRQLEVEEVGEQLFARGLSQGSVEALIVSIERQRRMLKWYRSFGEQSGRPTEHEVVAYMVLPMLLALGWSEQLLAVEWNKIDLAAFSRTPTTPKDCVLVCEAKRMWSGLQGGAYKQARGYVKNHHLTACRHILLTQGQRFYLYRKASEGWTDEPVGYLNLACFRERHLMPADTSTIDTLMGMTPQSVLGV